MSALSKIKPTSTLPAILAVIGMTDSGEYGNANCPHCGAEGRYVWHFLCEDGSRRGAMRGCIQLFSQAAGTPRYAGLIQEAFDRRSKAKEQNTRLASWWQEMIDAAEEFGAGAPYQDHDSIQAALLRLHQKIALAEGCRQDWLRKNGYSKFSGRRRR